MAIARLKLEDIVINLEDIIDSSSNAVLAINCAGVVVYCNQQVEKFLALPIWLIVGRHVEKFFSRYRAPGGDDGRKAAIGL